MNVFTKFAVPLLYESVVLILALILGASGSSIDSLLGMTMLQIRPLNYVGIVLLVIGAGLRFWASSLFWTIGRGTPIPARAAAPRRLVTSGPFGYVRNPLYLGAILMCIGLGTFFESPSILIFSIVLFIYLHASLVLYEETNLEKRFGEEYVDYKRRVPRWVPRFRS